MNVIIPNFPTYGDGQLLKTVERELRTGLELKKQRERQRELVAAKDAKVMRDAKEVKGLGRHMATMPAWEFFRLQKKYGHAELHSDEFMRYYQKKFPALATSKL